MNMKIIKHEVTASDVSYRALATKLDVSSAAVSDWLNENVPMPLYIRMLVWRIMRRKIQPALPMDYFTPEELVVIKEIAGCS